MLVTSKGELEIERVLSRILSESSLVAYLIKVVNNEIALLFFLNGLIIYQLLDKNLKSNRNQLLLNLFLLNKNLY